MAASPTGQGAAPDWDHLVLMGVVLNRENHEVQSPKSGWHISQIMQPRGSHGIQTVVHTAINEMLPYRVQDRKKEEELLT